MTYLAARSVAAAQSFVGYHEGNNNYNIFSPWQGLNPYNPWCASFTCYCAVEAGGYRFPDNSTFGYKGEAYTPTMKTRAEQEGIWRDKAWKASPGDFVEFDWGNDGLIDHVELVIADDGTNLVTIGGNTSNGVYYRKRDRYNVAGFVALSQSPQAVVPPPPFKVRPMFDPPRPLRAWLHHPDNLGTWVGFSSGRVAFLWANGTAPREGGMISDADRRAFTGRTLARLTARPYYRIENGKRVLHHGYTIVATSGETYIPEAQH